MIHFRYIQLTSKHEELVSLRVGLSRQLSILVAERDLQVSTLHGICIYLDTITSVKNH